MSTSVAQLDEALLDLVAAEAVELTLEAEQLEAGLLGVERDVLQGDADAQPHGLLLRGDVVAGHDGLPAGRREQRAEHLHGGGLPGPVGAEQAVDLTAVDGEVEAVDGGDLPERAGEAADGDGGVRRTRRTRAPAGGLARVVVCMGSNLRITAARS